MSTRKFLSTLIPALPMLLTALLVILVTVIFLATMRSKAHAQFGGVEQPMFQLTSSASDFDGTLQSIPGVHTYWVWTNGIITNAALRVTNWTALVSPIGNAFSKVGGAANDDPLNATNGVFFNGFFDGSWMTSSIVNFPTNQDGYTIAMIQKHRRVSGAPGFTAMLEHRDTAPAGSIRAVTADTNLLIDIRNWVGASDPFSAGYLGTNRSDFVIVCSNSVTPGEAGGIYVYIDAVLRTNRINAIWTNFGSRWSLLGAGALAGGNYYDGWVFDIAFYTNVLTSESISNIHYYNTNVYGPTGSGT